MRLLLWLLCFAITVPVLAAEPRVLRDIAYVTQGDARQKLDLYLPKAANKAPLMVFVHGGFWGEGDEKYGIGKELAETLVKDGVAVALVRYRLSTSHPHPAQIDDLATAFAYLLRNATKHRYDPRRVYLVGHSAGGHLVSLLALDKQYLAKHRIESGSIAGVVGLSGIYSLDTEGAAPFHKAAVQLAFGTEAATLDSVSPLRHVRERAPPFLLLNPEKDLPQLQLQARQFADGLAAASVEVDYLVIPRLDHLSIARPTAAGNPVEQLLLWRMGVNALPDRLEMLRAAKREWMRPPFSTNHFWERHVQLIESRPVDKRFLQALFFLYQQSRGELRGWPLKNYHRIELFKLLDALPDQQGGDYVVLRNIRDEVQVWHRNQIEAYRPVVVVGLDEERNLFKLQRFYQMRREYSWRNTATPPMMALPMGAFIYFENEPPPELRPQLWHYSLILESIHRKSEDPLASVRAHPAGLLAVLTETNGCVFCHSLKGTGSRSHHVTAFGARAHGGFALPLEAYPAEVLNRFLDRQEEVADFMGATPNKVDPSVREALRSLITQSRAP